MHKIVLLILICKNVIADHEDSNKKYIDLLPEEEKQEFLNRIARRILEGIKSKDTPNESHAEINDDQLDTQDAFVQGIMKEESDNFQNEKKQHNTEEIDENSQVVLKNDNRNENYKPESDINDKEEHIDLTLRDGIRQKRKNSDNEFEEETTTTIPYDVIPVKAVYDQFENEDVKINNKPVFTSVNKNTTLESDQEGNVTNGNNEIPVSDLGNSGNLLLSNKDLTSDSLNKTDNIANLESLRKSLQNKFKLGTTEIIDFEPNSDENYNFTYDINFNNEDTTALPITVSEEVTDSTTIIEEGSWGFTQKIYDIEEKVEENIEETTKEYNNLTNTKVSQTELIKVTTSSNGGIETNKEEDSTVTPITNLTNSNSNKSKNNILRSFSESNKHKDVQTIQNVTEPVMSESESTIQNTSSDKLLSEGTTDIKIVAKDVQTLGSTESSYATLHNNSSTQSAIPVKIISVEGNTIRTEYLDDNIKILRSRDDLDTSQIDEYKSLQSLDEDSNKNKAYEVFEVDSNQPHFLPMGKIKQNDHPLYVPVYNYSADNAYFRPYNKLGPNIEDFLNQDSPESQKVEDSNQPDLLNTRNRFTGYSKHKKRPSHQKGTRNTKQSYQIFLNPVRQNWLNPNIYYNPYDYGDSDYNIGHNLRRGKKGNKKRYKNMNIKYKKIFPDSDDEDHPISSIHKSDTIKDHIRAVRKILYLQNFFGHVPKSNNDNSRKANEYFQIGPTSNEPIPKNIAIDYYFGRADSDENDKENDEFRLNKHINSNILPITPNPLGITLVKENEQENKIFEKNSLESQHSSAKESISQEIREVPFKKLFESMLVVLKDSIELENENLVKYDWLKTSVNIQAAMRKLMDLIQQLKNGEHVHPKDTELLKYTIYLFKWSTITLKGDSNDRGFNKIKSAKKTKKARRAKKSFIKFPKHRIIKEPIKMWKEYAALLLRSEEVPALSDPEAKKQKLSLLNDFEDFLRGLHLNLNDLHDAIQHISLITKYNNQNWLKDLKVIYLGRASKKSLAQVILHLGLSRLLDSIEESASHGVEENFRSFMERNSEIVKKSKEECAFVLNVLEEIRRLNTLDS